MKKILSLMLVLCMLLSSCILFTSCGDAVSVKDATKSPTETLTSAANTSIAKLTDGGAGIYKVIEDSKSKASISISFSNADLTAMKISKLGATLYTDLKSEKYVLDAGAVYDSKDMNMQLFLNKDAIILDSEAILGADGALGIYFDTFLEKFENSNMSQALGLSPETAKQITDTLTAVKEITDTKTKENAKKMEELSKKIYESLAFKATAEKVESVSDKSELIVMTYTINNESIKTILNELYAALIKDYDTDNKLNTAIQGITEKLDSYITVNLTAKVAIDKKDGYIASISASGDIKIKDPEIDEIAEQTFTFDFAMNFTDTAITVDTSVRTGEQNFAAKAAIEKKTNDGDVSYVFYVKIAEDGTTFDEMLSTEAKFAKDGKLSLTAKTFGETVFEVLGSYKVSKNKVNFEITSLQLGEEVNEFVLGIEINSDPAIPKAPEKADDIIDYTTQDWMQLITDIKQTEIGELIFGTMIPQ